MWLMRIYLKKQGFNDIYILSYGLIYGHPEPTSSQLAQSAKCYRLKGEPMIKILNCECLVRDPLHLWYVQKSFWRTSKEFGKVSAVIPSIARTNSNRSRLTNSLTSSTLFNYLDLNKSPSLWIFFRTSLTNCWFSWLPLDCFLCLPTCS